MVTKEVALRTVLDDRFGICTCKDAGAITQEQNLFKSDKEPMLHYRQHKNGTIAKVDTSKFQRDISFKWNLVCLYSKEANGISLPPEAVDGNVTTADNGNDDINSNKKRKKSRKYRAPELVRELCEVCEYDKGNACLWRQEEGKKPSRRRICGNVNCVSPFHRDLHPDEEKRKRYLQQLELHALRCASIGVVDQAKVEGDAVTVVTAEEGDDGDDGNDDGGARASKKHKQINEDADEKEKSQERGKGDGGNTKDDDDGDTEGVINIDQEVTVSCGNPILIGWVANVKMWLSDEHIDTRKARIILDFMPNPPKPCPYRYDIKDIKGEYVYIHTSQSLTRDPQQRAQTTPIALTTDMTMDVHYHRSEEYDDLDDAYYYYHIGSARCMDVSATIRACGGKEALLDRLKKQCLDVQRVSARIQPPLVAS